MGNSSSNEQEVLRSRANLHEAENKDLKKKMEEMKKNREPLDVPWRDVGENFFSMQKKQELKQFIEDLRIPDGCENINFLMTGHIGSGKSSFANTLKTVFADTGDICNPAATYGTHMGSGTKRLHEITLKTYGNGKNIRIYDCRGIDPFGRETAFEDDLCKTIEGHIMKGYEFKKDKAIDPLYKNFRENPSISDKMHCVLFVMKATDENKMPQILTHIKEFSGHNNIPVRLILTSMDQLELYELRSVRSIFLSRDAKIKVERAKRKVDVQDNQILPVANYVSGIKQDVNRDVLALQAAKSILQVALSFIADSM